MHPTETPYTPPNQAAPVDDGQHTGLESRFEEEIARERERLGASEKPSKIKPASEHSEN
jgi:hypothetical protein